MESFMVHVPFVEVRRGGVGPATGTPVAEAPVERWGAEGSLEVNRRPGCFVPDPPEWGTPGRLSDAHRSGWTWIDQLTTVTNLSSPVVS